jgi:LmbE family N-acetylglucosaminyl deacetylase
MIVAHPDDETLWGGGYILRHPGDWTVQCCSVPVTDPVRAVKFLAACKSLGAAGRVHPAQDRYEVPLGGLDGLDLDFDLIVTHGPAGEYGHPHHVQVSQYVRAHARCPVVTFGGDEELWLTTEERARKVAALKCYDHVLPYEGVPMPKWEALLIRYGARWIERETYGAR